MIIYKDSPDGNAFAIMGVVRALLKEVGRQDEWPSIQERMMSGDYDNLCQVVIKAAENAAVEAENGNLSGRATGLKIIAAIRTYRSQANAD